MKKSVSNFEKSMRRWNIRMDKGSKRSEKIMNAIIKELQEMKKEREEWKVMMAPIIKEVIQNYERRRR